jgi:hypothetical protein
VLGAQKRVAEDGFVADHGDVLFAGHGFPDLVEEGTVVDLFVLNVRYNGFVWIGDNRKRRQVRNLRGESAQCTSSDDPSPWNRSCPPTHTGRR